MPTFDQTVSDSHAHSIWAVHLMAPGYRALFLCDMLCVDRSNFANTNLMYLSPYIPMKSLETQMRLTDSYPRRV